MATCLFLLLLSFLICNDIQAALQMPLRDAADKAGIYIGSALSYHHLISDKQYATIAYQQYSLTTAENACKWAATEPEQNKFNFTECDYVVNYAKDHNMKFRGHNLCWENSNPSWLTNGNFTATELKQILQNHISTVIKHYSDNVYSWDVVNEAYDGSSSMTKGVWYPAIPNYVELAFIYAQNALKDIDKENDVKLFYNDDFMWYDGTASDEVYNLVKSIVDNGTKIDGIGFENHVSMSDYPLNYNKLVSNMQRFIDLGLKEIHITEFDNICGDNRQTPCSNWNETLQDMQAEMYSTMLKACLAIPNCKNFETWDYTDKYSWLGENQHPLPWDQNFQPKKAAYAIENVLLNSTHI